MGGQAAAIPAPIGRVAAVRPLPSYAAWLRLAFLALVSLAVVLGAASWMMVEEARFRVMRGRVASDLNAELHRFDREKERLRLWTSEAALGRAADPARRDALLASLGTHLDGFATRAEAAARLDARFGGDPLEADKRAETLALLHGLVGKLTRETRAVVAVSDAAAQDAALGRIDDAFARQDGIDLQTALNAQIAVEDRVLNRQREAADAALARVRALLLGASGAAILAGLALAIALPRRLLRPLRALEAGVRAYGRGEMDHRFGPLGAREFAQIADRLGEMAGEIAAHRARERASRLDLESAIAARTAELHDALADLEASEAARRGLLADIGHELRTPLTVIRGEAQVALRDREADLPAHRASLGRIAEAAAQMGRLIDDLFALSRERAAALSMVMRPVDLAPLVARCVAAAGGTAAARGVRLTADPAPVSLPALADADRITQVVAVLIDNALRYSDPGTTVRVTARTDAHGVEIAVADRGIGIAEADRPRLFDRGWRGGDAQRRAPGGKGLGLAIAQGIAQRHGGSLHLDPNPGGGTCARLVVPAA